MQFSHLHSHTQYSLLDGASHIGTMVDKAVADNMRAIAITDHGNMFGVFKFVNECQKKNIKPIIGCEFYVVDDRFKKAFTKENLDKRYHQLMLAKNEIGYQNLSKLCSLGYIEGLYSKWPRIDKQLIEQYHEGLIATTCCLGAMIPQIILNDTEAAAETEFKWWLNIFGDDFYVELQRHSLPEQDKVNEVLLRFAKKYNVKTIATNDSHYVNQKDSYAHDILLCVNTGEFKSTPIGEGKANRFGFSNDQFYFKTTDEMSKLFSDVPESIDNTNEIVDKVKPLSLKKDILLPAFPIPESYDNADDYLRHLTMEGARKKYSIIDSETEERINFELETIRKMGFAGYFLIVSDFIRKGKEIGVMVGPGRGSAAGSAVAYCIDITNIDPIKYNLLFERFLNPDRKSMPDIDTDFDDEGRQKVIDYVVDKYGKNQVAQIVTYGTMAAKSSIKDVARVLELPLNDANALVKLVADKPGTSLKRLLNAPLKGANSLEEKEELRKDDIANAEILRKIYSGTDLQAKVLHEAEFLEGSVRNTGIHAAGIIIAPKDLTDLIPVYIQKDSPLWVTQIEGTMIEEAGVIKMDFLGFKTLSIIKNALQLIHENHGVDIDIDKIPLNDEKTFKLYQNAETNATFQFESEGMQTHLKNLKPDKFEDLIAMNALYRPGPMEYIPDYIDRKHGRKPVVYDLQEMEEYLKDTYGITVYQEQVMLLSQKIAGFSKGDADVLRKAMGKKQLSVLEKMKEQFISGATEKGHAKDKLEKIWTDWTAFAQYAFNKSHSTCYAFVAYQTAYLKAHYPAEYMVGVLNNAGSIEKITAHMEECKRIGIDILGPNINESSQKFTVNKEGKIRFALGGIKGLCDAAVFNINDERLKGGAFSSFFEMMKRVNLRTVNKKSLEALAMAGALDEFNAGHRAQYFESGKNETTSFIETAIRWAGQAQESKVSSVASLFGAAPQSMAFKEPTFPEVPHWSLIERLRQEKEVTGFYLSGHPLDTFKLEIENFTTADLTNYTTHVNKPVAIAGIVSKTDIRLDKNGNKYIRFSIEDFKGTADFMLFKEDYVKHKDYLEEGNSLYIKGVYKQRFRDSNQFEFKINSMQLLSTVRDQETKNIGIQIEAKFVTAQLINSLKQICKNYPGQSFLKIKLLDMDENHVVLLKSSIKIEPSNELINQLKTLPIMSLKINMN
ncbi:MAG: hypothetical protein RIQ33_148 [Bacteroidota bacterium]